jgi:hypothetical protein
MAHRRGGEGKAGKGKGKGRQREDLGTSTPFSSTNVLLPKTDAIMARNMTRRDIENATLLAPPPGIWPLSSK